jgi:cytoskeletal protein CcmA (bactofilin family)
VFKKVIGQDLGPSASPSEPAAAPSAPAPASSYAVPTPPSSAPLSSAQSARPAQGATRNVLSSDVEIKGNVKFANDLVVDGKIEGEINSDGNLTVGENARIKAEVKTGTVVVYGKVHGNITVTDRVELKASAEVVGDIKAKTLSIEAGAIFVGKSTVGTPAQSAPSSAAAKAGPELKLDAAGTGA